MIPDDDPLPRPPLTIEYAFLIALIAPLVHLAWEILFELLGVRLPQARVGMAALLTYGGAFALCAARFRQPPARQLGFVRAPATRLARDAVPRAGGRALERARQRAQSAPAAGAAARCGQ